MSYNLEEQQREHREWSYNKGFEIGFEKGKNQASLIFFVLGMLIGAFPAILHIVGK